MKKIVQNSSYTTIEEYKYVFDLFKTVILKIASCYEVINKYNLFPNEIDKINHSVSAILLCDNSLRNINKYQEIKGLRLEFEDMNINLKFLNTTFNLLEEEYKLKVENISEDKYKTLNNYKILFLNKLRNEYNLDLSKYKI